MTKRLSRTSSPTTGGSSTKMPWTRNTTDTKNYAPSMDGTKTTTASKNTYPLYDVPWLVRGPNERFMSQKRHELELRNQAVVDDYFLARDRGLSWLEARKLAAEKHQLTMRRTDRIIRWFFQEAKRRRKYDFLEKFLPSEEHIMDY